MSQITHLQKQLIQQISNEYLEKLLRIKQQKQRIQNRYINYVQQDDLNREQLIKNIRLQYQGEVSTFKKRLELSQQSQKQIIRTQKGKQNSKIEKRIKDIIQQNIMNPIVMYKKFTFWFSCQQKINDESNIISTTLQNLNDKNSKGIIKYLFQILNNSENRFYQDLINQQKVFQNFKNKNFLEQTNDESFQQCLRKTLFNQHQITEMVQKNTKFLEVLNYNLKQYSNSTDPKYY